ncbi:LysR family transcriptional regulator [Ewingella americana]|nr:LysR family transcriptional regulator [Ewingella americana]
MSATLDIELLRTFHAVAKLGQFRAAAAQVNKSPAAVSVHIQRLEAIAGGRLFDRDNQSVILTPLGERLLATTGSLLRAHDQILDELRATPLKGHIKLGVPDEYAAYVIRDILPTFNMNYPEVALEITTAPSFTLRNLIGQERLDIAISVCAAGARSEGLLLMATTPVWVGGARMALAPGSPLPLALHASHCPYSEAMTRSLSAAELDWRVILTSPSSSAIEACVETGLGISLIDRARVKPTMRILENLPKVPTYEVYLMRSSSADASQAVSALERLIAEQFRL